MGDFKKCPNRASSQLCVRKAVLACLQRLADGSPPARPSSYPDLAEDDGIMTARVGTARQARLLVYYVDVDQSICQQVVCGATYLS